MDNTTNPITNSILNSIKKTCGITESYKHFDADFIMHINSVFAILTQIGIGPKDGFSIEDEKAVWTDFMPESPKLSSYKSYMQLKVRLIFDPPLNSAVLNSMKELIKEFECRLNIEADRPTEES